MTLKSICLFTMISMGAFFSENVNAAYRDESLDDTQKQIQRLVTKLEATLEKPEEGAGPEQETACHVVSEFIKPEQSHEVYYAALQAIINSSAPSKEKTYWMDHVAHISKANIKSLLGDFADQNQNLLGLACTVADPLVVKWLLRNSCDVVGGYLDNDMKRKGIETPLSPFHCLELSWRNLGEDFKFESDKASEFLDAINSIVNQLYTARANVNMIRFLGDHSRGYLGCSLTILDKLHSENLSAAKSSMSFVNKPGKFGFYRQLYRLIRSVGGKLSEELNPF